MLLTRDDLAGWILHRLQQDPERGLDKALIDADSLPKQIESARRQLERTEQWERDHHGVPIAAALRSQGTASDR